MMSRSSIDGPARYYRSIDTIVLRSGLLLREERRHLWHELVHADRGDMACQTDTRVEALVELRAVRWAIPTVSLQWAAYQTETVHDVAELLKLPEDWVRYRWRTATHAEKQFVRANDPRYDLAAADGA